MPKGGEPSILCNISSKLPSDRPSNDRWLRELRTFVYDVADL